MSPKIYPDKSAYNRDELEKRRRQLSSKKGLVTKARNTYEKLESEAEKLENEFGQAQTAVEEAKNTYQKTEQYKQYVLLQSRETEEYAAFVRAIDQQNEIETKMDNVYSRLDRAEKDYDTAHEDFEKAEQEFERFSEVYGQVNDPMTYSEILRDQLAEVRRNQEQVRQETQNWSLASRASSVLGFIFIIVAAILLFTVAGQGNLALLSGIVGGVTLAASRLSFAQYNDAKKRFDNTSLRAENLNRELMGLSREPETLTIAPQSESDIQNNQDGSTRLADNQLTSDSSDKS